MSISYVTVRGKHPVEIQNETFLKITRYLDQDIIKSLKHSLIILVKQPIAVFSCQRLTRDDQNPLKVTTRCLDRKTN